MLSRYHELVSQFPSICIAFKSEDKVLRFLTEIEAKFHVAVLKAKLPAVPALGEIK